MAQNLSHHRIGHPFDLPPRWRWIFWPIIIVSGGGTAFSLWMEEETIAVAALPGLAAILYIFNRCVFKAAIPCHKDLTTPPDHPIPLDKKD